MATNPQPFLLNTKQLSLAGTLGEPAIQGDQIELFETAALQQSVASAPLAQGATSWSIQTPADHSEFQLWAVVFHSAAATSNTNLPMGKPSDPVSIKIRTTGPVPQTALPVDLSTTGGKIRVRFDEAIDKNSLTKNSFELRTSDATPVKAEAMSASVDANDPAIVDVDFMNVVPNQYSLYVLPPIKDQFGNAMDATTTYKFPIIMPVGGNAPTLAPGITATTGPYVPFQEYNSPRPEQNGFNPSDKVVSRVVRLYYFRDAHRVAQIVNRRSRSYNRAAVDVAAQLADRARGIADQETDARRALERAAVQAAQDTAPAQHALDAAQQAWRRPSKVKLKHKAQPRPRKASLRLRRPIQISNPVT